MILHGSNAKTLNKTIKSSNGKANGAPPALLVLVGSIPTPKFFEGKVT